MNEEEKRAFARWLSQLDINETPQSEEELRQQQLQSQAALKEHFFPNAKSKQSRVIPIWLRTAAAAVILLITTGILFLSKEHPRKPSPTPIIATNELLPGSNKAILTLGNGATITLDSAQKGKLAQQGNVNIVKLDSGKLAYTAANEKSTEVLYNSLSTPRGGQYQLTLPDGTRVWLDAESSINYPTTFIGTRREVTITGEAYFEVAPNKQMPFIVKVKNMQVQVLGTHFNVMAYSDETNIETTLLEGAVRVEKDGNTATLTPGQRASIAAGNNEIKVKQDADAEDAIAWKNGLFVFNDENIQSILKRVARWYDVDISYEGKIPTVGFNGVVSRYTNASNVFKILELTKAVKFKTIGRQVIVTQGSYKGQ